MVYLEQITIHVVPQDSVRLQSISKTAKLLFDEFLQFEMHMIYSLDSNNLLLLIHLNRVHRRPELFDVLFLLFRQLLQIKLVINNNALQQEYLFLFEGVV